VTPAVISIVSEYLSLLDHNKSGKGMVAGGSHITSDWCVITNVARQADGRLTGHDRHPLSKVHG
jgi:hypothetical protein